MEMLCLLTGFWFMGMGWCVVHIMLDDKDLMKCWLTGKTHGHFIMYLRIQGNEWIFIDKLVGRSLEMTPFYRYYWVSCFLPQPPWSGELCIAMDNMKGNTTLRFSIMDPASLLRWLLKYYCAISVRYFDPVGYRFYHIWCAKIIRDDL